MVAMLSCPLEADGHHGPRRQEGSVPDQHTHSMYLEALGPGKLSYESNYRGSKPGRAKSNHGGISVGIATGVRPNSGKYLRRNSHPNALLLSRAEQECHSTRPHEEVDSEGIHGSYRPWEPKIFLDGFPHLARGQVFEAAIRLQ